MSSFGSAGETGELAVLRVSGADARAFLQGQLSNDLRLLARDNSQLAALNTPQGRVTAIVRLFERAEAICAVLPRSMLTPTVERLRKYVLRSKVALVPAEDLTVVPLTGQAARTIGAIPAKNSTPATALHRETGDVSTLLYVDTVPRALLVGAPEAIDRRLLDTSVPASPWNDWRLAQIAAGEPQVYSSTSEHFVAQMLNLDLVGGLSFTKGCYTGQEIIVRTQHLGRIKRRMLRARHPAAESAPGDKLSEGDTSVGELVDRAVAADGSIEILAVMQLAHALHGQPMLGATPATTLDLPYPIETA